MADLNFCPYCSASQHKVISFNDEQYFCKDCDKFFVLHFQQFKCPKCGSERYENSDFPTPDGQLVIQCKKCRKMLSVKEFLEKNKK